MTGYTLRPNYINAAETKDAYCQSRTKPTDALCTKRKDF